MLLENKTIKELVDFNAKENPNDPFVLCPQTKTIITNLELKKGDSVCSFIENSLSSIYLMLGIMYAGMIQVPLNVVAGEEQLAYVLDHSDSNIVFSSDQYFDLASNLVKKQSRKIELIKIHKDTFVDKLITQDLKTKIHVDREDPALLMYTSCTTGKPKGVMLSNNNIVAGGQNCIDAHNISKNDLAMCVLPLFHINGAINTVLAPLISGSSLVLCEKFSVNNFWKYISEYKCTWFSVVPTIISSLINKFEPT